jgi:hypothetical protein
MRAKLVLALAALLTAAAGSHAAGEAHDPVGLWQAVDPATKQPTGWFLIRQRNGAYDGIIARMFLRPGQNPAVVCDKCKGDRHNRPWLGLEIIRGMKPEGADTFSHGTILDPRDGQVYDATMKLSPDGQTLTVRGYLGITLLGRNEYWSRLPPSDYDLLDPSVKSEADLPSAR